MTDARKREAKRRAKQCWITWCCLCSLGSLVGGVLGLVSWINDDSLEHP